MCMCQSRQAASGARPELCEVRMARTDVGRLRVKTCRMPCSLSPSRICSVSALLLQWLTLAMLLYSDSCAIMASGNSYLGPESGANVSFDGTRVTGLSLAPTLITLSASAGYSRRRDGDVGDCCTAEIAPAQPEAGSIVEPLPPPGGESRKACVMSTSRVGGRRSTSRGGTGDGDVRPALPVRCKIGLKGLVACDGLRVGLCIQAALEQAGSVVKDAPAPRFGATVSLRVMGEPTRACAPSLTQSLPSPIKVTMACRLKNERLTNQTRCLKNKHTNSVG